jgi:uncharacterized protein YndB with AHSA1/START domain
MTQATLISTAGKPVLRFERFLPRPVEDVWRSVTDPVEMRAWFPTRIEIDRWAVGAALVHHFEDVSLPPLPGRVLAWAPPHRLVFTWGDDTIGFDLTAAEGGTVFVLTEELAASAAARNAAGWEVCLERLVDGVGGPDWRSRFEHYTASFEPVLGTQAGPPGDGHS